MSKEVLHPVEVTFGEAAEETLQLAIENWLQTWRGRRSHEEMISTKLNTEEVQLIFDRRNNKLNVLATIRARAGTPGHTEWRVYRRVTHGAYKMIASH